MRLVLILVLLAGALWRAVADWQATIGQGYAYRFASIETVLAGIWPGVGEQGLGEPVVASIGWLPLTPILLGLAAVLWITRRRNRGR